MGTVKSRVASLDRQINGLQGQIDNLQKAASKLQGIAYDLQVVVETPTQQYDAGPSWEGDVRERFEQCKSRGKDSVDGLRRDVDSAREQIESKIGDLYGQQGAASREKSRVIALDSD